MFKLYVEHSGIYSLYLGYQQDRILPITYDVHQIDTI